MMFKNKNASNAISNTNTKGPQADIQSTYQLAKTHIIQTSERVVNASNSQSSFKSECVENGCF